MNDLEIAQNAKYEEIKKIAKKLNIEGKILCYGNKIAKIEYDKLTSNKKGKLILVTATSPTPYGEGKTTVSIGLLDALCKLGYDSIASLREPSLGPVFGMKGGATGGGMSQVIPMEDINLHFTGDLHAITSANNLICAAIDNHIYQGNELEIDENNIVFNRCMDVNDRALKNIVIKSKDYERKEAFDITAASEIMAIVCLAKDFDDLRKKIDNIVIAYNKKGLPIYAKELNITGSVLVLLKDAIKPNLVQTLEHNPVIVHGGPFANIAHGCSSVIATKTSISLSDYCITEAGFGSDLGALKFYDIKCRTAGLNPDAVILVTTIKALKYNGEADLKKGLSNLEAHLNLLKKMYNNIIICLNKFNDDNDEDIKIVSEYANSQNIEFSISTAYKDGSNGALDLAEKVIKIAKSSEYKPLYDANEKIKDKIEKIIKDMYNAGSIEYSDISERKIHDLEKNKLDCLPICVAKTQYSISDDKDKLGYPKDYKVKVTDVKLYNGAGFITIYLGSIITMPGLPKKPNYEKIDIKEKIIGLS